GDLHAQADGPQQVSGDPHVADLGGVGDRRRRVPQQRRHHVLGHRVLRPGHHHIAPQRTRRLDPPPRPHRRINRVHRGLDHRREATPGTALRSPRRPARNGLTGGAGVRRTPPVRATERMDYRASAPRSPGRMRWTSATSVTQSLPSPTLPVLAAAGMASRSQAIWSSSARNSTYTLGTKSTVYSAPRYTSVWPAWRPKPWTSVTVMPATPAALRASFTSSSLNGLMTAVISFTNPPISARPGRP